MQYLNLEEFEGNLHYIFEKITGLTAEKDPESHQCISAAIQLIELLCDSESDVKFTESPCSSQVHDAKKGGLADHTAKVFYNLISNLYGADADEDFYKMIRYKVDKPALIIGSIIHDLGKVFEYSSNGESYYYKASHLMLGVSLLAKGESYIVGRYGENTYYTLISIIGQHHGEFGEKPRTLEAYLVHLADMMDTRMTILNEYIENNFSRTTLKSQYIPFNLKLKGFGEDYEF